MLKVPAPSPAQNNLEPTRGEAVAAAAADRSQHSTKSYVRGSSLLLVGRGIAAGLNFAVQVLIVRALTVEEFGAFAYGLSAVLLLSKCAELGLDKGISRYLPIYQEQQDYRRMFGGLVLVLATVTGLGLATALGVFAFQGLLGATLVTSPLSLSVLLILVLLAPVTALEAILEKMLVVFAGARALFFRRHLLGPLLKLGAVAVLLLFRNNVYVFSVAYLLASVLGLAISGWLLWSVLRSKGLADKFSWNEMQMPAREIFGFSLPLVGSDVAMLMRASLVVLLLEFFFGAAAVAAFRAVYPVARLNLLVFDSFKTLFVPSAARLFAREDHAGIGELYWRNAAWLALLTFPLLMATFSLAEPTTRMLFGERYAGSSPILAILSVGYFIHVVFGFNNLMLRVYGQVKTILVIDLAAALVGLAANLIAIPIWGALGGAVATSATLVLQNVLHQTVLVRCGYLQVLDAQFARVLGSILAASLLVLVFTELLEPSLPVTVLLAGLMSYAVLWWNVRHLDVDSTFPELKRVAPLRVLLGLK